MGLIKFKAKEGGNFVLLPKATYDFQIAEVDDTEDSKKGDPQVKVTFEVAEGEMKGEKFPKWYTLTEKSGWALRLLLDKAGVPYDILNAIDDDGNCAEGELPELEVDPMELLGRFVRLDIGHWVNPADNKTYHQIDKVEESPLQAAAEGVSASAAPPAAAAGQPAPEAPPAAAAAGRRRRAL